MENVFKQLLNETKDVRNQLSEAGNNNEATAKEYKKKWFSEISYWEDRYAKEKQNTGFEWFLSFKQLQPFLGALVKRSSKVLHIGCGNSTLGVDLFCNTYASKGVINTDICPLVIEQMKQRFQYLNHVEWHVDDTMGMKFCEANFDSVIDKGCLDALLCHSNKNVKLRNCEKMMNEVYRVLKPKGNLILISFGQPEVRLEYFDQQKFQIHHYCYTPNGGPSTYIYNLRKR